MVGDIKFEIPSKVIETFDIWNGVPLKNNEAYDKIMVEALLLVFVTPENMAKGEVDVTVRDFIRGFLRVRTNGDEERIGKLEEYIAEVSNVKRSINH